MDVEIRLLRSFAVVAEELHFSRAANRLLLSQPALSRQIRDLERRIGADLLVRDTRTVALTECGKLLHREAARLLADLERTIERVRGAGRGEIGHLSIGFIGSAVESFVMPTLQTVRQHHPGLTFTLIDRSWVLQTAGLENGTDDLAFVRDLPPAAPWRTAHLSTEPVCMVVPDDHPLAGRQLATRSDLAMVADTPFLSNPSWMATHCGDWPFAPRVTDEMGSTHGIFALVRAHFGISFMPASYASWSADGLSFVPVEGNSSTLVVAWRADRHSVAHDVFLNALPPAPESHPSMD
ncbi:LysR substrate-binding domain-containing protein [Jiangella asiatica]|uniref:LysR family transcriptional regulator n=1 Tax=Jiangella asiatica TaxID=2530372 RepID=A0A4R5D7C2_9ACTN|nr:LysR substrate-binding domain-containing protein [Jiangella asiatica]TDE09306.1 LysR family transcriptional regulator [Jiangella asiatica]